MEIEGYKSFFYLYNEPSIIIDLRNHTIFDSNHVFHKLLNLPPEKINGKKILDILKFENKDIYFQNLPEQDSKISTKKFRTKFFTISDIEIDSIWEISNRIDSPYVFATFRVLDKDLQSLYIERLKAINYIAGLKNENLDESMVDVLKIGTELLGLEVGIVSQIKDNSYTILHYYPETSGLYRGQKFEFKNTYCQITFSQNDVVSIDSMKDSKYKNHPCYKEFGLESYIGVPVYIHEKRFGTLNFSSSKPTSRNFNALDYEFIKVLREWVGLAFEKKIEHESLILAKESAEMSSRAKTDFLAIMSHEIRTPMNGIIGMTSLLSETPLNLEQKEFVEIIRNSGENLLIIINDILDFSKIESGKFLLEEQPFNLRLCIEDTLNIFIVKAAEKNIELVYYIDSDVPIWISSDVTRVKQILMNLIGNAIKFTEKGEIFVKIKLKKAHKDSYEILFEVIDTGIGIPEDRIHTLFEEFTQVDSSISRKYGGTGLGLAISSKLASLLGGELFVQSELNKGSNFNFYIKARSVDTPNTDIYEELTDPILKKKKILIVDKNRSNLATLKKNCKKWEMDVYSTGSFEEALGFIKMGVSFDIALINHFLLGMTGYELALKIHDCSLKNVFPMILMTSIQNNSIEYEKSDRVFFTRLNKPIKLNQLFNALVKALENPSGKAVTLNATEEETEPERKLAEDYPLRILVAEDNIVNQQIVRRFFIKMGYKVNIVANGFEVLESLERQKYNMIFMDIQMPEMDGIEAAMKIRQLYKLDEIIIIAMTANAFSGDKEKCLRAGMNDYITKPVALKLIQEKIIYWGDKII